ncbi:class I SAM-dependent methyltransferase [Paenibacillus glycanilyticus]|uniref:Methyltransferase n=1 Tax=Paenibacillus glycanilyticus TaxID=126569 RepID=A0ABQ6GAJ2_9BACL|nr:class I SAM-dependent methyltransferase [Paenibacillus glycanilyticus]GLX67999.1 methyltransferase [Paenibacillus glycanilyticus]
MSEYYWNSQIEYLSKTRWLLYNDDYLEFLVQKVWKISTPVRMVDFGCGYGYMGLKLMPLLPAGSTYTGIDAGDQLIARGEELFQDAPFETRFMQGDIQTIEIEQTYDLAVCHAFLLHVPNPNAILQKMLDSLVQGGRIICFEPHWISGMANYHLEGNPHSDIVQLGFLQKLFERDAAGSGSDGNIGIKLPVYLSALGVKQIDCRLSDKVNFLDANIDEDEKRDLYQSIKADGFGAAPSDEDAFIAGLIDRGATYEEAKREFDTELSLSKAFQLHSSLVYAPTMKITSGIVERGGS